MLGLVRQLALFVLANVVRHEPPIDLQHVAKVRARVQYFREPGSDARGQWLATAPQPRPLLALRPLTFRILKEMGEDFLDVAGHREPTRASETALTSSILAILTLLAAMRSTG